MHLVQHAAQIRRIFQRLFFVLVFFVVRVTCQRFVLVLVFLVDLFFVEVAVAIRVNLRLELFFKLHRLRRRLCLSQRHSLHSTFNGNRRCRLINILLRNRRYTLLFHTSSY